MRALPTHAWELLEDRERGTWDRAHVMRMCMKQCLWLPLPMNAVLFADCVGFTSMSKASPPHDVMMFLNQLFSRFDQRLSAHNHLWKVETAGDACE